MNSTKVYLCWRFLSVISWFTDQCFYRSCRGGLKGFGSQSPLAIFYTVIIKSNCAVSHRISLTSAVKWQEKGDSQLNPMYLAEYVLKNFLSDFLNSANELTPEGSCQREPVSNSAPQRHHWIGSSAAGLVGDKGKGKGTSSGSVQSNAIALLKMKLMEHKV